MKKTQHANFDFGSIQRTKGGSPARAMINSGDFPPPALLSFGPAWRVPCPIRGASLCRRSMIVLCESPTWGRVQQGCGYPFPFWFGLWLFGYLCGETLIFGTVDWLLLWGLSFVACLPQLFQLPGHRSVPESQNLNHGNLQIKDTLLYSISLSEFSCSEQLSLIPNLVIDIFF